MLQPVLDSDAIAFHVVGDMGASSADLTNGEHRGFVLDLECGTVTSPWRPATGRQHPWLCFMASAV